MTFFDPPCLTHPCLGLHPFSVTPKPQAWLPQSSPSWASRPGGGARRARQVEPRRRPWPRAVTCASRVLRPAGVCARVPRRLRVAMAPPPPHLGSWFLGLFVSSSLPRDLFLPRCLYFFSLQLPQGLQHLGSRLSGGRFKALVSVLITPSCHLSQSIPAQVLA